MRRPAIASERVTPPLGVDTIVGEEHAFLARTRWRRGSHASGKGRVAIIAARVLVRVSRHRPVALRQLATPRGGAGRLYTNGAMNGSGLATTTIGIIGTGVMAESILAGILHEGMSHPEHITCSTSSSRAARSAAPNVPGNHGLGKCRRGQRTGGSSRGQASDVAPGHAGTLRKARFGQSCIECSRGRAGARTSKRSPTQACRPGNAEHAGADRGRGHGVVRGDRRRLQPPHADEIHPPTLGAELEVNDEDDVAKATAVSGTGPTYAFLFIEAMIDAAVHMGFPRHLARELVLDTVKGSAAFAEQSGRHAAELRVHGHFAGRHFGGGTLRAGAGEVPDSA